MSRSDHFEIGASPVQSIVDASHRFRAEQGIPQTRQDARGYSNVFITKPASSAIAHAYDSLPDFDKQAVPAYRQMAEETKRQFDFMTRPKHKGGMGIDVQVTKEDPYGFGGEKPKADYSNWSANKVVPEFRDDVVHRGQMKVYATASTGEHPILSNDENDMFRAVHDTFGHLGSGRGIDAHGEEAAYLKHSSMFSPLARQALATETRGQNAALHLHGEFQNQKVALLPAHMQTAQFGHMGRVAAIREAVRAARADHAKQGI